MGLFDDPQSFFSGGAMGPLGQIIGDYMRNVASGQVAASGPLGQSTYDPARSFAENARDPRSLEQALGMALGMSGGGLGIKAYHGSPHDFSAFDMSKIGTGEGAQAYGHGMYFAEAENVARRYRESLAGYPTQSVVGPSGEVVASGSPTQLGLAMGERLRDVVQPEAPYLGNSIGQLWGQGKPIDAGSVMRYAWGGLVDTPETLARFEGFNPNWKSVIDEAIARTKPVLDQHRIETTRPGTMYEVNLNAEPHQFLDWDKPFMDQPQAIQDTLAGRVKQLENAGHIMMPGYIRDMNRGLLPGSAIYHGLGSGTPESASAGWSQAGIPGIRYLDQGSRGAGEGTSNYVMFDPSLIEILRKYGVMGPAATGAGYGMFGGQQ